MSQQIVILGGSGFVGRHLIARLQRDGHQLCVLTRNRDRCNQRALKDTTIIELDVQDHRALAAAVRGADTVINLVGILNERGHDGTGFRQVHEALPSMLVETCCQEAVPRLLHMSALGADARHAPSHYLRSKGAGNDAIISKAGDTLQWTIIQPSVIFGPDDSFFMRFAALLKWAPVFPLACPKARFAPVYVEDVVEVFARCLQEARTGNRHIELCGPQVMTLHEVVAYTAQHSGRRRWIVPLNDGLSRLQANVMEYLPGKPFSRDNYQSTRIDSVCGTGSDALRLADLGMAATPVDAVMPAALRQA